MTHEPYRPTVPDFGTQPEENELDRNGHPNLVRTYIAPNPTQEPEANPAPDPQEIKEAPFCNAESTRNKHGKAVLRLRFESFEALETYFAAEQGADPNVAAAAVEAQGGQQNGRR